MTAHTFTECSDPSCLVPDPLVSVVMPAYNHERYLRDAIQGVVQQQTQFSIELIIGDDCSTDRTKAIALSYQRTHPRLIRVLSGERNVGMHENALRLLSAARGRYVAFCEGDDCWHRADKLSAQISLLERTPDVSLVCSSWRTISEDGALLRSNALALDSPSACPFGLDDILAGRIKTVTVCVRTDLVQRALKDSPLCRTGRYPFGDAPLWVEASRAGQCLCLPDDYATYRLSRNSATRPRDILDVYRFVAGSSEFDRDVLGIYDLPQGSTATIQARIAATRKRLRALAMLGDSNKVREELWWLCRLGAKAHFREYLLYLGAVLSQPGTWGAAPRKWGLLKWHALTHRNGQVLSWSAPQKGPSRVRGIAPRVPSARS